MRIGAVLRGVARFGRLTAAGLGLSCVVIGHATAGGHLTLGVLVGLLLVGLAFHVVAFALNDLFDLDLDRTDPSRAAVSPLIRGQITPLAAGIVIAAVAAASFVVDLVAFGLSGPRASASGTVALGLGYLALAFYDAFSKNLPVPLVADLVQGAGWACLVWYGAVRGGGATIATWLAGLFVVGFVVIVNAVHGGLRDLRNDSARGMRTTAIAFGATVSGDSVTVPSALRALAWLLQAGLAALAVISPLGVHGFGWWIVWYVGCLAATAAAVLLLREGLRSAAHPDAPIRSRSSSLGSRSSSADSTRFINIGAAHILVLWIPLTAMTAMYGGVAHFLAALAAMVVPMLGNQDFRTAFAALPGLAGELRPHVMTAATRARHGVARVAADIRSRVGSRS